MDVVVVLVLFWEQQSLQELKMVSSLHAPSKHHRSLGVVGVQSTERSVFLGFWAEVPSLFGIHRPTGRGIPVYLSVPIGA